MKFIKETQDYLDNKTESQEADFNKNGKQVIKPTEKVNARILTKNSNKLYFIETYNNQIFDPIGINSSRKNLETKLKQVSKETFDFYLIYLQTKNSIYLTRANRRFINE